jgi:hypothetical protein
MSPARSNVPLERDAKGHRINKHGRGGYARGCGCDVCTDGNTVAKQEQREEESARTLAAARRSASQPGRWPSAGRQDAHHKVRVSVRLSRQETAAYKQHVAGLGDAGSGFVRDLLLDALSGHSRPPAPARPPATHPDSDRKLTVTVNLSEQEAVAFRKHVEDIEDTQSGFLRDLIHDAIGYEDNTRRPARRRPNRERQDTGKQREEGQ